jgi:hypothetical protein
MPNAECRMPNAECRMLNAECGAAGGPMDRLVPMDVTVEE